MSHRAQKWLNGNITVIYWSSSILLYSVASFNGTTADLLLLYRARNNSPGVNPNYKITMSAAGALRCCSVSGCGSQSYGGGVRWRGCWGAQQHSHQQHLAVVSSIHASPEAQFHSGIRNINIRNQQHVMTRHLMRIDNINCILILISVSYPKSRAINATMNLVKTEIWVSCLKHHMRCEGRHWPGYVLPSTMKIFLVSISGYELYIM